MLDSRLRGFEGGVRGRELPEIDLEESENHRKSHIVRVRPTIGLIGEYQHESTRLRRPSCFLVSLLSPQSSSAKTGIRTWKVVSQPAVESVQPKVSYSERSASGKES